MSTQLVYKCDGCRIEARGDGGDWNPPKGWFTARVEITREAKKFEHREVHVCPACSIAAAIERLFAREPTS